MGTRRSMRSSFAGLLLALGAMTDATSQADAATLAQRTYQARAATAPILIDGRLDDPAWANAHLIEDFFIYQSGGVAAPPVRTGRLLWDADFLYVGLEVLDRDIRSAGLGHDGALYEGDNAELFLAPTRGAAPYYEFEFSPDGATFDALFDGGPDPLAYESALLSAVTLEGTDGHDSDTDTGYTVEFAVPRAALAGFGHGDTWTLLVAGYDYHPTGEPTLYLSSAGETPSGFHTLEIYDDLAFAAVPEPSAAVLLGSGLLALGIEARLRRRAPR